MHLLSTSLSRMYKKSLLTVLLLTATVAFAQDSSKVLYHEVGFNSASLLQQLRVFTVAPQQQPYDIFYNIYYKDKFGIRLGLGIFSEETLTQIEGQRTPRSTNVKKQNFRIGGSYHVLKTKKFAINLFCDGFLSENTSISANTSTVQVFPNPIATRTVKSKDEMFGGGVQGGVGLRWAFYKHLALYTELPIVYGRYSHLIEDEITESGEPDVKSRALTETSGTSIALPVTIYLVLRF